MSYILSIDAGTTSSRAIIFDHKGKQIALSQKEFPQYFPQESWVEHDANEIWETQLNAIKGVIKESKLHTRDIAAIGITNQRETTIIWDRKTGEPVHKAIVWQDRRTAGICNELNAYAEEFLEKTGLVLDAYFSGTKIKWILDQDPDLRQRANAGELAFGTVDSWLIWKLTHGKVHVTDVTNASRTLLYNIHTLSWDNELLKHLEIPKALLPKVVSSSELVGHTDVSLFGEAIPISGIAGDQQAALFGQLCIAPGDVKNTYGTGCFCIMNTGEKAVKSNNKMLTTIGWQINNKTTYALEGSVFIAGALVQWLRDQLQIIDKASDIEALAKTVDDNGGITFIPALSGLGAPYWDPEATGAIMGITRGSQKGHIARAALEAIALRTRDIIIEMQKDAGIDFDTLKVDGGASTNDLLMQIQADLLQSTVIRPNTTETTALGAAFFAGLAVGYWDNIEELKEIWEENKRFSPQSSQQQTRTIELWEKRIKKLLNKNTVKRNEHLKKVKRRKKPWDILIIGGGASGLGAAVDAASRGYRTLLLEKNDFAKGTSSRSTKLVHGGVRYLQNGDVSLVIEALKERGIMRKNAPHLVQDLSFVIPSYDWWNSPFYGIGLKIYDMMAGKLGLGPSTLLDRDETIELIPNVKEKGLRGGVIYHDGQFDDARMAISLAQTAENHGASLLNYFTVTGLQKENEMTNGIYGRDELTGKGYTIEAKVIVNATGVFSDDIIQMDEPNKRKLIVPSQGVHIVLEKNSSMAHTRSWCPTLQMVESFAVPWNNYVVVGTTDTLIEKPASEPKALEKEIKFILDNAGAYMTMPPTRADVKSVFAGLRPLAAPEDDGKATKEISRHHKVTVSTSGLVSILGGKWTTYRKMAEDLINTAQSVGGLPERACITQNLTVHGYDYNTNWENPMHVYGADIDKIIELNPEGNESLSDELYITKNMIVWAAQEEMAMTLEDVLARRTRALFLNAGETINIAPRVVSILAESLNKDKSWEKKQLDTFLQLAQNYQIS